MRDSPFADPSLKLRWTLRGQSRPPPSPSSSCSTRSFGPPPLLDAVAGLPTRELAGLSRTLVSLAAFRSQLALDQAGSVGGEMRVAVLTKHGEVQLAS